MQSVLTVPTCEEKDFCHFCYGATNLHLVFPLARPDLLTTIDNIIGISIAPEAQETFSLCGECIATTDMIITFRSKCRSHYEKLREMKIMNQAVKRMFPTLRDNMNQSSPSDTSVAKDLNGSFNIGEANRHVALVETTSTNAQAENDDCKRITSKRSRAQTLDLDPETSTKKAYIKIGTNHKARSHHIREIMNRFRNKRLQDNAVRNGSLSTPISSIHNTVDLTHDRALDQQDQPNSNDSLNVPSKTSIKPVAIEHQLNFNSHESCTIPNKEITIVHQLNLDDVLNAPSEITSQAVSIVRQPNLGDVPSNEPSKTSSKPVTLERQSNLVDVASNAPSETSSKAVTLGHQSNPVDVALHTPCKTSSIGSSGDSKMNALYETPSKAATRIIRPQNSSNQTSPRRQPISKHCPNTPFNLMNENTFKNQNIFCTPCIVVVQKFPVHQNDLCKS